MPRVNDPSTITSGGGLSDSPLSTQQPLTSHLGDPGAAHPASSVTAENTYLQWSGTSVQNALGDLSPLIPPEPGPLGSDGVAWLGSTNTGIPDWGILKLRDGAIPPTGNTSADVRGVYPYYYRAPVGYDGVGLTGTGLDPVSDPTFNYYDIGGYPTYTGCGEGQAHAGFATVSMAGGAADGFPSWRILPPITDPAVVVSGIVSPADRGVLALVKWDAGTLAAPGALTTTANVLARCPAALLLGQGLSGADGQPGGIFEEAGGDLRSVGSVEFSANPAAGYTVTLDLTPLGLQNIVFLSVGSLSGAPLEFVRSGTASTTALNFARVVNDVLFPGVLVAKPSGTLVTITLAQPGTAGNFVSFATSSGSITLVQPSGGTDDANSPYNVPGRVGGQYNLDEIHTGSSTTAGPSPYTNPAAGQVRLLTDSRAFPTAGTPTTAGGIPILGATAFAVGTSAATYLPYGLGGGTTGNFFAYRLPYLADYSVATGLIYTAAAEKTRYTSKLPPATAGSLTAAGAYDDFTKDFWAYQVARYRHRFVIGTGAPGSLRRDGSYALVHFRTERAFEAYVRDGVVPTEDNLYSVNMVSWSGSAQMLNLADDTSPPVIADPYHLHRSEIEEDPNTGAAPALGGGSDWTFDATLDSTWYSGIRYLVPRAPGSASAPAVGITSLNITLTGLFNATYRTHDKIPVAGPLFSDNRRFFLNMNPVFISLGSFIGQGTESPVASGITIGTMSLFPGSLGEVRRQRIEFGYADLTAGSDSPATGDSATIVAGAVMADSITFAGDTDTPVFTQDAKLRVFVRRPLAVSATPGVTLGYPLSSIGGNTASSRGFTITETGGDTILYHSMKETNAVPASETVVYGNAANPAKAGYSATKDRSERFLDEVYRYPADWSPLGAGNDLDQLLGPGLPHGVAPVNVLVRPLAATDYEGYYIQSYHMDAAYLTTEPEAQVAGLPPRNPPASEGLVAPLPSRGLLMYPQKDYSTGYTPVGADYSGCTGPRIYIRAFDGGAANVGAAVIRLKFWGVTLADFAYLAPGPGNLNLSIGIKVPGKTSWMDAGRADGSGPSKQDVALDGAGCQVVGANTFDGTDAATQIHYAQVEINLGTPGALFLSTETRCPVLVAIGFKDTVAARAYNFEQGGEDGPTTSCRGFVGVDLTYPAV